VLMGGLGNHGSMIIAMCRFDDPIRRAETMMARAVDGISLWCFRAVSWRRFLVRLLFASAVL
jgi:hypothetical protein